MRLVLITAIAAALICDSPAFAYPFCKDSSANTSHGSKRADEAVSNTEFSLIPCELQMDDASISDAKKGVERRPFAITATGNVLTVVAKHAGTVQTPFLCCSVQTPMRRISDDVFAIKLALARLNEAMLTFYSPWEEESDAGASVFPFAWRGSTAPAAPMEASSLTGEIVFVEFWSDSLDETRKVELYLPKDYQQAERLNLIIMADGLGFAPYLLEPLMEHANFAPSVIIGLKSGEAGIVEGRSDLLVPDLRAADYVPGYDLEYDRFSKHIRFVFDELLPYLRSTFRFTARRQETALAGFSNGGVFAMSAALTRPNEVGAAIVLSAGVPLRDEAAAPAQKSEYFISAGLFEPKILESSRTSARWLEQRNYQVSFREYAAGHAEDQWKVAFVESVQSFFSPD